MFLHLSVLAVAANICWIHSCCSAEGMKAGNYGNLLVQIEQPKGEYAVTIAFLSLIKTLVKVGFYPDGRPARRQHVLHHVSSPPC